MSCTVDEVYTVPDAMMLIRTPWEAQSLHSHRPIELVVSLDGPIEMRCGGGKVIRSDAFLVPPMRRHALSSYGGRVARLYVDPGHRSIGAWKRVPILTEFAGMQDLLAALDPLFIGGVENDSAHGTMRKWIRAWIPSTEMNEPSDPRVAAVLQYLEDRATSAHVDRQSMARLVGLSPSRFGAIFAKDTGASLGRYLIWRRVKIAMALICGAGESVTKTAAAAGFSDGAHLTRCCRATYGCPPSHLLRRRRPTLPPPH